jgi:hypothetical protein
MPLLTIVPPTYAGKQLPQHHAKSDPAALDKDGQRFYYTVQIDGLSPIYLYQRKDQKATIVRLEMIYVTAGEPFFLRLLVKARPFSKFKDLLSVDGVVYPTFQQAAVKAGLVLDHEEALECFREASRCTPGPADVHLSAARLRGLFAHLTLNGFPTLCIFNDDELLDTMLTDWRAPATPNLSRPQVIN